MIRNYNHCDISCWSERRGPTEEWVIWNECENYVVVLSARRDYWLLKTAYVVTYDSKNQNTQTKQKKEHLGHKKAEPDTYCYVSGSIALSTHGR